VLRGRRRYRELAALTIALATALEAFIREHESCGELDTGLEDDSRLADLHVRGSNRVRRLAA